MGKLEYSVVILAFVAATSAGPVRQRAAGGGASQCSQICTGSDKFKHEVGSTYEYKYDVITRTSVLGASEDTSGIGISAFVQVEVISKCEHVLKLNQVKIEASDSRGVSNQDLDGEFARGLETYPLRFSFQDGRIESVCPHDSESPWALNIKKGVISSFQNTMMNLKISHNDTESDVVGKCRTEYNVAQEGWKSMVIKKTKDVSTCSKRNGFDTAIQTVPFTVSSGFKSLEILKVTYECDQTISSDGILTGAHCHELQLFRPFSKDNSGAATETSQSLSFIKKTSGVTSENAEGGSPQELYFVHEKTENQFDQSPREALLLLRDMCVSTAQDIKMDTPAEFSTLVYLMKKMNFAGLRRVYNQANKPNFCNKNGERIQKFVLDALPMIGTAPAVELMKTLISNNNVKGAQADTWLASLAFIHNPTSDMIEQVLQLTGLPSLSSKVLLPLSSLVHAYCRINTDCEEVREVREVIQLLERNIGGGCVADQQNFRKILMSLRGLGNTGHADSAVQSLSQCFYNKDNSMDIRVAAIQAYRRLSCAADRNNLMSVFRDVNEDSELRINAYLEVMRCPTQDIIVQIKQVLSNEEVQQVGSFVWTHLTNLMESSDPANKYVQRLLNDNVLDKEFDLEKLKFSRNYEASAYLERFNAGGKYDSNVIFSTKSFVPRSASLNLTFDLFGESMNLFEVGGRVEGMDHMLESYFGTAGYFNDKDKSDNEVPQANPKFARLSGRKLRDIHAKAKKSVDDLRGAIYTRMFGNELTYNMFGVNNGIDDDLTRPDMFEFVKKLRNSEKQDMSMTKSLMFLDSTYTVPTLAGLPLNLKVNGTSTVALNADGKIDMKKPGSKIVIEGMFEPSGAVQVDSMMSVDAFVTKGGMKMVSTLYTSTGAQAKIEVTNENVFDLTFDLTKEKSEIVKVKTSFFLVQNEMEKEQNMIITDRYEKSKCSGDHVLQATGLLLCVEMSGPNTTRMEASPNFPLTGPVSMSISVEKKDMPNGYKMEAKTIKSKNQMLFRFLSETPGSTEDRAVGLDVVVDKQQMTLDVSFLSPWAKIRSKGELTDNAKVKGLLGTINVDDDSRIYKIDAKILVDETKDRRTYTPTITVEIPDWKNVYLTGQLNYKDKESFDADLTITGAMEHPIAFISSLKNTNSEVGVKSSLKWANNEGYVFEAMTDRLLEKKRITTRHTYKPRVFARTPDKELIDMTATVIYIEGKSMKVDGKLDKVYQHPITLAGTMQKSVLKKNREKYVGRMTVSAGKKSTKLNFLLDSRNWKFVSNKVKLDYKFGKGVKDTIIMKNKVKINNKNTGAKVTSNINSLRNNDLDASFTANYISSKITSKFVSSLKYGKNLKNKDTKERLDFNYLATYKMKNVKKTVNYTAELKLPAHKIDAKVSGGYIHDDKNLGQDITIQYHPERAVSFHVKLHNKTKNFPHYAGQLGINLPQGREMFFAGAFGKESEDKYISSLEFELIKGRKTKLDGMFKIATEKVYEVEVGVQLPDLDPVRVQGLYKKEKDGAMVEASFMRGQKLYSITVDSYYKTGVAYKISVDTKVPERRVKVAMEWSHLKSQRRSMIDVQWDADNNLDDRFLLNVTTDYKGWDDFEVASTLHYPTRTINFDMKHSSGPRYITSAELSWSPKDKMDIKIIFRDDLYNDDERTELQVEFHSPFKKYEELGLGVSIIRDSSIYQTKSSLTWGRGKKVLVTASTRVPITASRIDITGEITTPYKSYRKMVATIRHRLTDELESSFLLDWGRQRILTKVSGKMESSPIKRSYVGDLEVRTPFEGLRIFMLHGEHNDDGRKFTSKLTSDVTVNSTQEQSLKYTIEMDMTHDRTVAILDNRGTLEITIPNDYITNVWEIKSQLGNNHFLFDHMPRRGNQFKVAFDETHQLKPHRKFETTFDLVIPNEHIQELNLKFNHEDRTDYLKTQIKIVKDRVDVFSEHVFYERGQGHLKFERKMRSAYGQDFTLTVSSTHNIMPYNLHTMCQWADNQVVDVNSYIFYDKFGTYDITVDVSTPFQQARNVKFIAKRERRGLNWDISTKLDYAPRQSISVDTSYRIDHIKFTSVSIRTPFPQFSSMDASFKIDGNINKLDGEAELTVVPYVNKISTNFNWAYYAGTSLMGEFNLNTPFRQYPYMKMKVDSNMLGVSRVSTAEIEYLPTQIVKIESDYRFTSLDTLQGTLKVTSPYTENKQVVASFKHVGDREEFTSDAKITCECFERAAFTKATYSSKDAIALTFTMDSPFRGYETVDMKFNHRGELEDFKTHFEYETNGEQITLDNVFNVKSDVEIQMTLLTPFKDMTRSHFELTHTGTFPNTQTKSELAFNDMEGHSDIILSHNDLSTILSAELTTPFKKYESFTGKISRQGDIHDFSMVGDFKHVQPWKVTYSHTLSQSLIRSSALLTSPALDHDFRFEFNQTNKGRDFTQYSMYSMGTAYVSTSETKLKYDDLPNLEFKTKTVTVTMDEKKMNEIILLNAVQGDDYYSKFYITMPNPAVLIDTEMSLKSTGNMQFDLDSHALLELPIPNFTSTQFVYTTKAEQEGTRLKMVSEYSFDTDMLEKFEETVSEERDLQGIYWTRTTVMKYGQDRMKEVSVLEPGKYTLDYESTYEGLEKLDMVVEYGGSMVNRMQERRNEIVEVDGKYVSIKSGPRRPIRPSTLFITATLSGTPLDEPINARYDMKYDDQVEHKMAVTLPYKDYKQTDASLTYEFTDKYGMDLSVDNTAMSVPVKASANMKLNSLVDFETTAEFTSGFTNFTSLEFIARSYKEDSTYKRYMKMSWEDSDRAVQMIEVDTAGKWVPKQSGDSEMGAHLKINTPFNILNKVDLVYDYELSLSPLSLKETMVAQYNAERYLDMTSEFSSDKQISGLMEFTAPRPMTFSLTAENEGESVTGDLNLNWNKNVKDSFFRMEFGLSDSGDMATMKKIFLIRVTHPDRIVGIHNELERSDNKVISMGKVYWDEAKQKEATYDLTYTINKMGGANLHDALVKVTVPSRSVEASASFKDSADEILGSGSLLWDAGKDRNKQVEMKLVVSPNSVKKTGELFVILPSINKKLSLTTDLSMGQGRQVLDGQTKFSYTPKHTKDVVIKYSIMQQDRDDNSYRMDWSLEHDDTKTYAGVKSNIKMVDGVASGDVDFTYKKNDGSMAKMNVQGEANMADRKMFVRMFRADNSAEINGQMTSDSPYTLTLSTLRNDVVTWKTVWAVDTEQMTLDASMTYGKDGRQISTTAYLPTDKSFISETERNTVDGNVQEGRMAAELEDRKLHGHLKWRPELVKDVMVFSSDCLKDMMTEISRMMEADTDTVGAEMMSKWRRVRSSLSQEVFSSDCLKDMMMEISRMMEADTDTVGAEMMSKWRRVRSSLSQELSPIMDTIDNELRQVQREMREMRKEMKRMYRENDLYMKTIDETYGGAVKKMMNSYTKMVTKVGNMYKTLEEKMEEMSNEITGYPIKENYNKMVEKLRAAMEESKKTMNNEIDIFFNTMRKRVTMMYELYDGAMKDISATTRKYISKFVDEIVLDPYLDSLREIYTEIVTENPMVKLSNEQIQMLLNQIQEILKTAMEENNWLEKYKQIYQKTQILKTAMEENDWLEKYKQIYQKTQVILSEQLGMDEISTEVLKTVEELHDQVSIIYQYMDMDFTMLEILQKLSGSVRERMMSEFNQLPLGLLDLHKSRIQTFDLEKGEIEFDLYLPIPMENFEKMMRFSAEKYMKRLRRLGEKYFPRRDFVMSDFYYRFTPIQWSMKKDWVPPFDAYATVSGKDHYTTFDGTHIQMAGLCSYVLVSDVVDGNFSIVQKYKGGPRLLHRDSLVVMVHGTTVELFKDKILVDEQPTELPYLSNVVEVVRSGPHVILTSKFGIEVISDFERDFHIIGLSGWYFGKVGGILGSYDNEPANDKALPDGRQEENDRRFMNAWEVAGSCRSSRYYGNKVTPSVNEKCSRVFDETASPLRPCFLMIDPSDYQYMCNADPTSLCKMATLYSQICTREGIIVSLPTQCLTCSDDKGSEIQQGETLKYESKDQTSQDVVMIVEESQCNKDVINKLTSVVYELDQALIKTGSTNNRFSFLGYTVDKVYQHTMEGKIFNDASKFAMATENLKLAPSNPGTDPFNAIKKAIDLPFRAGVARTFVLVSCMACVEDESYRYRYLRNELGQRDITLHVMRKSAFHMNTNRNPNSRIFGIDNSQILSAQTRKAGIDNYNDVYIPQDYCSNLALATNGSVFDSSQVLIGNVRQQRSFMQTVGSQIVNVDDASECQICMCEVDSLGLPQSICRRCDAQNLYYKPFPDMLSAVVNIKNSLTHSIQKLM